jgi:UDP-N-acetylglucosamine--dolichyl-phosphate N-acetylglucosaminephosphotransferase
MTSVEWYVIVVSVAVSFLVTFFILPRQISYMHKINWVGHDIHKHSRPAVAESGGVSVFAGVVIGLIAVIIMVPATALVTFAVLVSICAAAAIGFLDDKYRLSALKKIVSVIFAAIPMFALYLGPMVGLFPPIIKGEPPVPFIGLLRVPILYALFIPGFLAVLMNVTNMLEGYNGQGSGTSIVVTIALIVGAVISNSDMALIVALPLLGALVAFFYFNRFPAKVFPGDIGTLLIGMAFGCIAIVGSMEFALIVAIIPHVFNAFHVIRSVRGFKESATIKVKDIELIDGDLIKASTADNAPLTIPRIVTAPKPLSEPALVKNIIVLNITPAALSVLSSALVSATLNQDWSSPVLITCLAIAAGIFVVTSILFPAIRGLNVVFGIVYAAFVGLLVFIDQLVIDLGFINWLVAGVLAMVGLGAWYLLSMRYFNRITTRKQKA